MKKFLKYVLRPHWKLIIIILILSGFQTYFQLEIIDLFNSALNCVKQEKYGFDFKHWGDNVSLHNAVNDLYADYFSNCNQCICKLCL